MFVTTSNHHTYSYLCRTSEIVNGIVEEPDFEWKFTPLAPFSSMSEVEIFVIGVTEQCNLRCTYCCYSGEYKNNRTHGLKGMTCADIDEIYDFILRTATKRPLQIAFYGGEPLLQYPLIQYAVDLGRILLGSETSFSIVTNATLLTPERIDWLIEHGVKLLVSIDGTKAFHDRHRAYANGNGSFDKVRDSLSYIIVHHPQYQHLASLQMTMPSYRDIERMASEWHHDSLLGGWEPSYIHGLAVNFAKGVKKAKFEEVREFYEHLLDVYEQHQDWSILRLFFKECIANWKHRPVMEIHGDVPMSTCMPLNPRLYIDTDKQIAVCEKISDRYRIGSVKDGIDWAKANEHVRHYFEKRVHRCAHCPAVRVCALCLTAIEFNDEQWDVLCHNERIDAQISLWLFCEMAERGLVK